MGEFYSFYQMLKYEADYMIVPCLVVLFIGIIWRVLTCNKEKKINRDYKVNIKREIAIVAFCVYLAGLFSVTLTPEKNIFKAANESFFHLPDFSDPYTIILAPPTGWIKWKITLGDYTDLARNIAGNILIFVPFGFLLPYIFKKAKAKTILLGFLLSFFIEFYQLFTDRQTDINDIILNTAGTVIGYLLFLLIRLIINKSKTKKKKEKFPT